ncbi:MAG: 2-dehydro-3-deoxygalactonokinase [Sphingomonadaceae bacterium]|nr:2-dehydro-3-deoxygalactonokinase [Sphingomonadaceae bacterium]
MADFLAIDWGTTNRRGYVVGDGEVLREQEDGLGILEVAASGIGFEAALAQLKAALDFDGLVLMGGMVGSNRGWIEAPYVACPAGLDDLAAHLAWIEPGRVAIVPGLSFLAPPIADVMRGEEVQILGAIADGSLPAQGLVCHPGTHNKWIEVEDGRIAGFRTVMTGELFNLLRKHSILSDLLEAEAAPGPAFCAGVDHGLANADLTAELFQVRARVLLGQAARADAAAYVSGLLIGNDLKVGLGRQRHDHVHVVGRPELTRLFAAALAHTGRATTEIDGDRAFVSGLSRLAEKLL